jgi:hypothetical protein
MVMALEQRQSQFRGEVRASFRDNSEVAEISRGAARHFFGRAGLQRGCS